MKVPAGILALNAILAASNASSGWLRDYLVSMAPGCLEILGNTTTEDEGRTYIIGSVRNNCDRSFSKVTILFKLDGRPGSLEGLPEGAAYAYGRDVKAAEIREFKTVLPISRETSFRFAEIKAH